MKLIIVCMKIYVIYEEFVCFYISPPLEETRGHPALERRTGRGSASSRYAGLSRSIDVQSGFP